MESNEPVFERPKRKFPAGFGNRTKLADAELEKDEKVADESFELSEEDGECETIALGEVEEEDITRVMSGIEPLDRVLGGGAVLGTTILIGGEPGVGKSTLLTEAISAFTKKNIKTLYACGEEQPSKVKFRASRLGLLEKNKSIAKNLFMHQGTNLEKLMDAIEKIEPQCIVVDSIQMYESENIEGFSGSTKVVKQIAEQLVELNSNLNSILFLVCHLTKDKKFAGPKSLEHLVDCNLMLENVFLGDPPQLTGTVCLSAPFKNRYGSRMERGFFKMTESGLVSGTDPSDASERSEQAERKRIKSLRHQ